MFFLYDKDNKGNYFVKDSEDGVIESYKKSQLVNILKTNKIKILGIRYENGDYTFTPVRFKTTPNFNAFTWLVEYKFMSYLRQKGVVVYEDEGYCDENSLEFETRFLGGFGAWSGSEDLCDAEHLDSKVRKAISLACAEFQKDVGVRVEFCTGEKAWTYFYFY